MAKMSKRAGSKLMIRPKLQNQSQPGLVHRIALAHPANPSVLGGVSGPGWVGFVQTAPPPLVHVGAKPLAHVGTLASDDADLALVYARTIYDEFTWVEMVLYPRASSISAISS